jgi:hypothetical protein
MRGRTERIWKTKVSYPSVSRTDDGAIQITHACKRLTIKYRAVTEARVTAGPSSAHAGLD